MTTPAASRVAQTSGRTLNIGLWVLQVLLALAFLFAGSGKLLSNPDMVATFDTIGAGQWFRYLTGILEVLGAVLLLIPGTAFFGAVLLVSVMVGAVATHLFILQNAPTAALAFLFVAALIAWGRRLQLARR